MLRCIALTLLWAILPASLLYQKCTCQPAAEEEDSYTKEETKTPRFVNLVHAASIQKQQGPPGQAVTANGHTPRSGAYASEDAFAQQSAEQLERSGLVTSSLPEPLEQQVRSSYHIPHHAYGRQRMV